ncbi:MAG TPA: bifunctional 4-hydroxy-2-oxoglutarate aldolase/2-dehydro-3-deoxy-phosphogluconate aldolase [Vineibacter sp.]|nr:bifunctional 4-hydroxy-2-oxoglutarate aldolase/2-dehydro-3-deoxy-phosphogluconate aldolase [Vineibacter sp.]
MTVAGLGPLLDRAPVIPVLTLDDPATAVNVAKALVAGGLPVLEVTLRTAAALDAVRAIVAEVPGAVVGVGTILAPAQFDQAIAAGAQFAVSPGHTPDLLAAAVASGLPYLPGMATASEAMALYERGYQELKFFPAEASGGVRFLRALLAPMPTLRFCPTGGIEAANASTYLALPNVACVGGSWTAPAETIRQGAWGRIEDMARAAAGLRPSVARAN